MSSNQNFNKDYKKLWIMILAVSIITILVAYGFGVIFSDRSNFPLVGTQDGWLSLFGALGGGAMTLFGVFWTINDQQKARMEELSIQFKPMIVLKNIEISKNNEYVVINEIFCFAISENGKINSQEKKHQHKIIIILENVGFGEGFIEQLDLKPISGNKKYQFYKINVSDLPSCPPLPVKESIKIGLDISECFHNNISDIFDFHLSFQYRDLFHHHTYINNYKLSIGISVKNSKREIDVINYIGKIDQLK